MGRAPCCEKVGLKRGRWTAEEDQKLVNYIHQYGEGSWRSLPKNAGLLRCGKSCRLRWINYLRSDLKRGNITPEEEDSIIQLHSTLGNKWSAIASELEGRTDNEIKNYWNSHLSRRIHRVRRANGEAKGETMIIKMPHVSCLAPKRRGGRTSRGGAMQKNKELGDQQGRKDDDQQHVVPAAAASVSGSHNSGVSELLLSGIKDGVLDQGTQLVVPVMGDRHSNNNNNSSASANSANYVCNSTASSISRFDPDHHGIWDIDNGDWDWDIDINGLINDHVGDEAKYNKHLWGDKDHQHIISCLWENEDSQLDHPDFSNQEQAMVAWLLS